MAEFKEVSKAYVRMCESYSTCEDCPIEAHGNDLDACRCSVLKWPEKYESKIMLWAAKHPEPVYPTFAEWLNSIGVTISDQPFPVPNIPVCVFQVNSKMFEPIPADIAEKLGIEPKEDV